VRNTPRRSDRRHRACQEGSWEGGGSLVGTGNSVVPCGGKDASDDGKMHHRECNLLYFTRFGVILTGDTPRLAILAPQSHPVRLWSQNHEHAILMSHIQCQGGLILGDVRREGYRQNRSGGEKRGEASATGRGVVSGPRATVLGGKTRGIFFCFVQ